MPEIYILHSIIDSLQRIMNCSLKSSTNNFFQILLTMASNKGCDTELIDWSSLYVHCFTPGDHKMFCRPQCPKSRPVRLNGRKGWRE